MLIKFIEIQNFRKLKSIRVEFADKMTLFVGANNSGKTSAMVALGYFLINGKHFSVNDFTASNWSRLDALGTTWEAASPGVPSLSEWDSVLPTMDIWLKVESDEIHYVKDLLPSLEWDKNSLLGVRLRYEPKDIAELHKEYISARKGVGKTLKAAEAKNNKTHTVPLWPGSMRDFLSKRLNSQFAVQAYLLDPKKIMDPLNGQARPQLLPDGSERIERNPLGNLIKIDSISAQRGFGGEPDLHGDSNEAPSGERSEKQGLSSQLRAYYTKHIDPSDLIAPTDVAALEAIHSAEQEFNQKLHEGFDSALQELNSLGYPGVTDPKLVIASKIRPMDTLTHSSALQYSVISKGKAPEADLPRLPEHYNGLGYQNLISMVFKLMSFRDAWMKVGKESERAAAKGDKNYFFQPLHLVLVEEPEAYLHAQVQQVFIRKAYSVLRKHSNLGDKTELRTQLVISTHSSHIAHECEFAWLRYFRRLPALREGEVPVSQIVNLSTVFGYKTETERFVARYLKATHCDLFFADAAILVEGPAERMLVPHFIRKHYEKLSQSYISILEIGGSHAHRLKYLIDHLGLTTLIVTDLDSAEGTGRHPSVQPMRGKCQITRNPTLKDWWPQKQTIDELLNLSPVEKIKKHDEFFSVRVAYQCPINVEFPEKTTAEAISKTFEDSLLFENVSVFKDLKGDGLVETFSTAISAAKSVNDLSAAAFKALKDGDKARFALDLLFLQDPTTLKVPTYIGEGLAWLQEQLSRKHVEIHAPQVDVTTSPVEAKA